VLIEERTKKRADVHLVDPHVEECVLKEFAPPERAVYHALSGVDALVPMTAHSAISGFTKSQRCDAHGNNR
jgi:UDP-N-acetyl-D-mannosaminuronate dehydrogenase